MTDTTTPSVSTAFDGTIKALLAKERNAWQISDSLLAEWVPTQGGKNGTLVAADYDCTKRDGITDHQADGSCCLFQAQRANGLAPIPYNTARANRAVAEYWPVADRFDTVSFSAHRAAMANGAKTQAGVNALKAVLQDPKVDGDPTRVTVSAVKAVVGDGKGARAGNARKADNSLSIPKLIKTLLGIRVNDNLAPLNDKTLAAYVSALESALEQAQRHQATRSKRQGSTAKATKSSKKKASSGPATARG